MLRVASGEEEPSDPHDRLTPGDSFYRLLLTDAFVSELELSLSKATSRVWLQVMTFDGDSAGLRIAQLLCDAAARGVEVRLLVDCFARRFVSDTPVKASSVKVEAAATEAMYKDLRSSGVQLRFTRPNGWLNMFALMRNHKKIYVIDDGCYIGGINISEHNFAWYDFNLQIDDPSVVDAVVGDYESTWSGRYQSLKSPIVTNKNIEPLFDELVISAKESVILASPYAMDIGLARVIEQSQAAEKILITNPRSNLKFMRAIYPYLSRRMRRGGFSLRSFDSFSHAKFLLVDDTKLLAGSANFGRHSFWCNEEICILIEDPHLIAQVKEQMISQTVAVNPTKNTWFSTAVGILGAYGMQWWLYLLHKTVGRYGPLFAK